MNSTPATNTEAVTTEIVAMMIVERGSEFCWGVVGFGENADGLNAIEI